jgi:hypothetical protein
MIEYVANQTRRALGDGSVVRSNMANLAKV